MQRGKNRYVMFHWLILLQREYVVCASKYEIFWIESRHNNAVSIASFAVMPCFELVWSFLFKSPPRFSSSSSQDSWASLLDLDLWSRDLENLSSNAHSHDAYLCQISSSKYTEITRYVKQMFTDGQQTKLMLIARPKNFIWPCYDLNLWPPTLKSFSTVAATQVMNFCAG